MYFGRPLCKGCAVLIQLLRRARQAVDPGARLLLGGLPGLDGYELCRVLRAQEEFKSARFIAISGYAQKSDVELSRSAGFDAHFAKPVEFSTLFAGIALIAGLSGGCATWRRSATCTRRFWFRKTKQI